MYLYVTRHGETEYNVLGRYCGSTDIPLNDMGIAQAHELTERLQGMKFDAVISSPMLRARQTADIVCAALNIPYKIYEQFAERNMGVYEGLTREEARELYPVLWNRQCTSKADDAPDGGETLTQACNRINRGLNQLRQDYQGKSILLICHGFAARAVHRYCCNLTFEEMASFVLGNCEVVNYVLDNRYARNGRATGIVLHDNKIMFMQQIVSGILRHVFVGGGIEENETPEQAVLRELKEEANVEGKIMYGPVYIPSKELNHEYFFLLSINDDQLPKLGYDPEIPKDEEQALKGIVWREIDKEHDKFTAIDKDYISILTTHATEQNIQADWLDSLLRILSTEAVMDKISFKENIKKYYDTEAELRNSKSVKADWKVQVRGDFCELIKRENKKTLLELGAGAGYDSQFFMNNGLKVVAVDLSSEMVKNCREKSIEAYELDFYNLSSLDKKFDCIYAINTLLHVPKNDLRHVLNEINHVLEKDGLFYMGLYGGKDTENEFVKSEVSDKPRFFAFYSDNYLKSTLEDYFEILDFETLDIGSGEGVNTAVNIFHSITMRKKEEVKDDSFR